MARLRHLVVDRVHCSTQTLRRQTDNLAKEDGESVRVTHLCVEDGQGPRCVQRDENPDQELLMLGFQRQRKAIYDATGDKDLKLMT